VMTFESAEDFLLSGLAHIEDCIVLDMRLLGMSGLDLWEKLALCEANYPSIFIPTQDNLQWLELAAETDAVACLRKVF
jgi:FixJ family two-component response regulator